MRGYVARMGRRWYALIYEVWGRPHDGALTGESVTADALTTGWSCSRRGFCASSQRGSAAQAIGQQPAHHEARNHGTEEYLQRMGWTCLRRANVPAALGLLHPNHALPEAQPPTLHFDVLWINVLNANHGARPTVTTTCMHRRGLRRFQRRVPRRRDVNRLVKEERP
jgi:hypothetical protein